MKKILYRHYEKIPSYRLNGCTHLFSISIFVKNNRFDSEVYETLPEHFKERYRFALNELTKFINEN